ncbi:Uncharacterized protein Rs2_42744 [Raphanus sativus]|nr:Uncharacterized protein Rs2_42744 [Raphanus sativus]
MQTTINAHRLQKFRPRLAAGSIYSISAFDVARCAQNFKLTDSSLLIVSWLQSNWEKLVAKDTGLPSAAPLLRGYAKVEPVTIPELNDFISTALSQEVAALCLCIRMCTMQQFYAVGALRASEAGRLLVRYPPFIAGLRTLSKSDSLHISSPPIIRLSPCIINEIDHAPAPDFVENVGDGNDVDDAPDGRPSHGKLTSSSGGCEASKSAGKSQLVMRIRRLTRLPRWSRRPVLLEMEPVLIDDTVRQRQRLKL